MSHALNEKFYRAYMTFFEQAERSRRWNPFTDVYLTTCVNAFANHWSSLVQMQLRKKR